MASSFSQSANPGAFVTTTQLWGRTTDERLVQLHSYATNIALALNLRDSGYYIQEEFVNGQLFFPRTTALASRSSQPLYRQAFRKVINFGALPNAATKTIVHDIAINNDFVFTRIYGTANNPTGNVYLPLPYSSTTLNENIKLYIDRTNITITTGIDYSAYTTTYVIVEYLKQ